MKIALISHPSRERAMEVADTFKQAAAARELDVVEAGDDAAGADIVVSVGGDGTVLRASRLARGEDLPVLGINVGYVGFLAEVEPDQVDDAVASLADGAFEVVDRMTVSATLPGQDPIAGLNDVVAEKVVSQHAVRLAVRIDGAELVTYRADGVVVATPVGSSAYSYSAGGPLIHPELDSLIITPVAPHSLFSRAVVTAPTSHVQLEVLAGRPVRVNIDGIEAGVVEPGGVIEARRGDTAAKFVSLYREPFASNVRRKLGLDGGRANGGLVDDR